jgi:Sulfotransferase family
MNKRKPILVTGSTRSGTTWVGTMLALHPSICYINEPFKLKYRPGIFKKNLANWFTYVNGSNEIEFYDSVQNMLQFRYNLFEQIKVNKYPAQYKHTLKTFIKWQICRHTKMVPLLKDPIAVFSTEWFYKAFDMNIVVMIRHPAAFANSLKRYNHKFPFSHFLSQPLLMKNYLAPFVSEIKEFAEIEQDILSQAALLWKCIYHIVNKYQKKYKHWIFLRHEDIAKNPTEHFSRLYTQLGLEYSQRIESIIHEFTKSSNPKEIPLGVSHHHLKLNSQAVIGNWKKNLSNTEIERIRQQVESVSNAFYSDIDW